MIRTNSDGATPGIAVHRGRPDGTFHEPVLIAAAVEAIGQLDDEPGLEMVVRDPYGIYAADALAGDARRDLLYPAVQYVSVYGAADLNGDLIDDLVLVDQRPDEPDRSIVLVSRP